MRQVKGEAQTCATVLQAKAASHDRDAFFFLFVRGWHIREAVGKFYSKEKRKKAKLKIKGGEDDCSDVSADLDLSRVLGVELQGLVPLPVRAPWLQHGLQLLVVTGQLQRHKPHQHISPGWITDRLRQDWFFAWLPTEASGGQMEKHVLRRSVQLLSSFSCKPFLVAQV